MFTKKTLLISMMMFIMAILGQTLLSAWETPMMVASKPGAEYHKPEVAIGPSGTVYVVYREKNSLTGNSDIMMCMYDGKTMKYENASNLATKWNNHKGYEPDVVVDRQERVYVGFAAHNRNDDAHHHYMYRVYHNGQWSQLYDLGVLTMHGGDFMMDVRLGVDSKGNVHMVGHKDETTSIWFVSKYGDTVLPITQLDTPSARVKHPDLAVDDNYIHVIWMRKIGFPYAIMYQKWENKINAVKGKIRQITFPKGESASQKSRIDVGSDGMLHFAEFYKTGLLKKLKYYKEKTDGTFTNALTLSDPNSLLLYHWATMEVRDNSILVALQLGNSGGGEGVFYNWYKEGKWGGYSGLPGTVGAVHTSCDLTLDGKVAAVAYGYRASGVKLVMSGKVTAISLMQANFTAPANVFYSSQVTLDATSSIALNPGKTITKYDWSFGDGGTSTSSSPTTTHSFAAYGSSVNVTLTVTASTGESGSITKAIPVKALYNGIIASQTAKRVRTLFYNRPAFEITWNDNPKNTAANFPTIVKYQIWRAPHSTSINDANFVKVSEVNASVKKFLDYFGVLENTNYVYSIRSVDSEGHISPFSNL